MATIVLCLIILSLIFPGRKLEKMSEKIGNIRQGNYDIESTEWKEVLLPDELHGKNGFPNFQELSRFSLSQPNINLNHNST